MRKRAVLALVAFLSFFVIVVLPSSWNICLPGGCSFDNRVCSDASCVNETLDQHLSERTLLFSAIVKPPFSIAFLTIVLFAIFASRKYFLELIRFAGTKLYVRYKPFSFFCGKLFNYLLQAFSDGILHPQIYFSAN